MEIGSRSFTTLSRTSSVNPCELGRPELTIVTFCNGILAHHEASSDMLFVSLDITSTILLPDITS